MSDSEDVSEDESDENEIPYTYYPMILESTLEQLVWHNSSSVVSKTSPDVLSVDSDTIPYVSPVESETILQTSAQSVPRQKLMTDFFPPKQRRGYTPELWWLSPSQSS